MHNPSHLFNSSLAERIFGIRERGDPLDMMAQANLALTGARVEGAVLLDELALVRQSAQIAGHHPGVDTTLYEPSVDAVERMVTLNVFRRIFRDEQLPSATILGALPLYQAMYLEHTPSLPPFDPDRKSLLVGSMSPVSSAAFVTLSESVLGTQAWIVDPRCGRDKRRHGNNVAANGFALPEDWSDSIHAAVTNSLLHMALDVDGQLLVTDSTSEVAAARRLADGLFRVLEVGGHVLCCERPTGFDMGDVQVQEKHNLELIARFDERMAETFASAGFVDVAVGPAREPESIDYLYTPFDPAKPMAGLIEAANCRAIYARKPL